MEELVLPIESYGLFKQRSMLHNCTQLPTLSGNADVQIATIPRINDMDLGYIGENEKIMQVEKCFDWVIYRVEDDGYNRIYLRKGNNAFVPFNDFVGNERNNWGHFTSVEFVDKDAERWVVVQFNEFAYKFREDVVLSRAGIDINLPLVSDGRDFDEKKQIVELFINGTYYEAYKFIENFADWNWWITNTETVGNPPNPFWEDSGTNWWTFLKSMVDGLWKLYNNNIDTDGVVLTPVMQEWFTSEAHSGTLTEEWWGGFFDGFKQRVRFTYYNYFKIFSQLKIQADDEIDDFDLRPARFSFYNSSKMSSQRPQVWSGIQSHETNQMRIAAEKLDDKIEYIKGVIRTYEQGSDVKIEKKDWDEFLSLFNEYVSLCDSYEDVFCLWYGYSSLFGSGTYYYNQMSQNLQLDGRFIRGGPIQNCLSFYQNDTTHGFDDQKYNVIWNIANLPNLVNQINSGLAVSEESIRIFNSFATSWETNKDGIVRDIEQKINELTDLKNELAEDERFETDEQKADVQQATHTLNFIISVLNSSLSYINSEGWDGSLANNLTKITGYISADDFKRRIERSAGQLSLAFGELNRFNPEATNHIDLTNLLNFLYDYRKDFDIQWIESLSHMLIAVASDNTFFYSLPGTSTFESLNFYNAEYANSMVYECWRLANRLVMITNNTVEFWDITNDFEDPLSPAYSSNVYSIQAIKNSLVRFNDTLYFIGKPVEMDTYSIFSLTKNGQLTNLSYPQLETWVNMTLNPQIVDFDKDVIGSAINIENTPFIQWNLKDDVAKLTFNIQYNTFCWNDELYFLCDSKYWLLNGIDIGTLDKYYTEDGYSTPCTIITTNSNFDGVKRCVNSLFVDVDVEEDKRDPRERILWENEDPNDPRERREGRERIMWFSFDRVSKLPWTSMRRIKLQPQQGSRNVVFKVFGIGLGVDFQSQIKWNGYLRINKLRLELE